MFDPLNLTHGEKLLLERRRFDLTQQEAAKMFGVVYSRYNLWERDEGENPPRVELSKELEDHEICFILRRRAGVTQKRVADKIGCCRRWLNLMERGVVSSARLLEFWAEEGVYE